MELFDFDELTDAMATLVKTAGLLGANYPQPPEPWEVDAAEWAKLRDGVDDLAGALDDWRDTWTRLGRRLQRYLGRFEEVLEEASGEDP